MLSDDWTEWPEKMKQRHIKWMVKKFLQESDYIVYCGDSVDH